MFYTLYTVYTVSINSNIRGEYIYFFCLLCRFVYEFFIVRVILSGFSKFQILINTIKKQCEVSEAALYYFTDHPVLTVFQNVTDY